MSENQVNTPVIQKSRFGNALTIGTAGVLAMSAIGANAALVRLIWLTLLAR